MKIKIKENGWTLCRTIAAQCAIKLRKKIMLKKKKIVWWVRV